MDGRGGVRRLLNPASVAIVGASDRIGPGFNAWNALQYVGFKGRVWLVNPRKDALLGQPVYPSLGAVPGPVDAVFVAVPHEAVLDAVRQAAEQGAGGAVVLSSGFAEAGADGVRLQRELAAVCGAHGMALCGPNCLGFLNFAGAAALFGTSLPGQVARGGVAAVAQSGSIGIALLNAGRGLGLSHLITSGNEAVTTAADFLDVLVEDPEVTTAIAFLEQLRAPERFMAVARRAREAGKPVIVVKTGRSERGRRAVMAHTGALAGDDAVCDAAFRAAGVIRVGSLDELMETAMLVSTTARPRTTGIAVLSPSGGEIALALDIADGVGLTLPPLPAAGPALAALLPDFASVGNPLDLGWSGLYDPAIARRCAEALGREPEIGMLVLLQDAPRGLGEQQAARYARLLAGVAEGAASVDTPLVVVSNLAGEAHPVFDAVARDHGVACLRGTHEGLAAVARYARWATTAAAPAITRRPSRSPDAERRLREAGSATTLDEHAARAVVAGYGLAGPRETRVTGVDEAVAAAHALGFPVVMKALVPGVAHKTEAGLVRLGIRTTEDARAAAAGLLEAAGPSAALLVAEMVQPVAELLVGARVDPEFGPIVVVGAGGVLVELYRDVAIRMAPVSEAMAAEMIRETRAAALLGGWRGRPAGDLEAAAGAVAALSAFIDDFRDEVLEVEVNPLAVLPRGALALDCLLVRRPAPGVAGPPAPADLRP
jgi:acyl-CoA synthetase (NDP forming)